MERLDAVLDASFWIDAERSRLTGFVLEYFRVWAPPWVVDELTRLINQVPDPPAAALLFASWMNSGDVQIAVPRGAFGRFDVGENQAIALAHERGWVLLIDNQSPRHFSRGPLRLRVIDSPAFSVFLYDQARLSYAETVAALRQSQAGRRMVTEALVALEVLARRKGER